MFSLWLFDSNEVFLHCRCILEVNYESIRNNVHRNTFFVTVIFFNVTNIFLQCCKLFIMLKLFLFKAENVLNVARVLFNIANTFFNVENIFFNVENIFFNIENIFFNVAKFSTRFSIMPQTFLQCSNYFYLMMQTFFVQ